MISLVLDPAPGGLQSGFEVISVSMVTIGRSVPEEG